MPTEIPRLHLCLQSVGYLSPIPLQTLNIPTAFLTSNLKNSKRKVVYWKRWRMHPESHICGSIPSSPCLKELRLPILPGPMSASMERVSNCVHMLKHISLPTTTSFRFFYCKFGSRRRSGIEVELRQFVFHMLVNSLTILNLSGDDFVACHGDLSPKVWASVENTASDIPAVLCCSTPYPGSFNRERVGVPKLQFDLLHKGFQTVVTTDDFVRGLLQPLNLGHLSVLEVMMECNELSSNTFSDFFAFSPNLRIALIRGGVIE
uniref:Uncharacterized protein n=1 Tax=Moniliophthora roreri TaxID=221103 RepID=A0A0W0FSL8_MONRR